MERYTGKIRSAGWPRLVASLAAGTASPIRSSGAEIREDAGPPFAQGRWSWSGEKPSLSRPWGERGQPLCHICSVLTGCLVPSQYTRQVRGCEYVAWWLGEPVAGPLATSDCFESRSPPPSLLFLRQPDMRPMVHMQLDRGSQRTLVRHCSWATSSACQVSRRHRRTAEAFPSWSDPRTWLLSRQGFWPAR